jgi:hypothetical protein
MNFLLFLIMAVFVSCSFKSPSDGEERSQTRTIEEMKPEDLKNLDSDGDMISNFDELVNGTDPFVADIPKVDVSFLQDYAIEVIFEDESTFKIDTVVARDNPNFKYRVGDLFLKENSLSNAAKLGRFSGVSWGEIKQEDFSWVKYPNTDKEYYHSKVMEFTKLKGKKIKTLTLELENTLRLRESAYYPSIKDLEVNFYYYSHSKESYVLIHTEKIDKVFQGGVRENFAVTIHNPPLELFEDNYLRRGEFIISEVKDFYCPDRKIQNSQLLASVKNKSMPIYVSTPFKNEINYVAVKEGGERFIPIMQKLYADKFAITDEKLSQVEQFSNKISGFRYLHEIKDNDKDGNWFVMTNKIKEHYLNHNFNPSDSITLSYITGKDLANQRNETFFALTERVESGENFRKYPLGNVTKNSVVDVSIYINSLKGIRLYENFQQFFFAPQCGRGNCSGANWSVHAEYMINSFAPFSEPFRFHEISEIGDRIKVLINNTELDLAELTRLNLIRVQLKEDSVGQYLHVQLTGLDKIEAVVNGSENTAFLVISPVKKGSTGVGVQINKMGGHNIDFVAYAGIVALNEALKHNVPLAVTSWQFEEWEKRVPWGQPAPNGWIPTRGERQRYHEGLVVDIVSTITNNFN